MTQIKKRLGLAIPASLYGKLRNKAEYEGKTINATCLEIFWKYFESVNYQENQIDIIDKEVNK